MVDLLIMVLSFLFVLGIVVTVHELGHFLVARWCGVEVTTFSVGFGPELWGFTDRKGTHWRIAAIPLGGYVKFYGDADIASTPDAEGAAKMSKDELARSFIGKPLSRKAMIVAAGPLANFILAIVIFTVAILLYGRATRAPLIEQVEPGTAAEAAGFKPGDLVVSIDGTPIRSFVDLQRIVSVSAGRELRVVVSQGGVERTLTATPRLREIKSTFGTQRIGVLGILAPRSPDSVRIERYGLIGAIGFAFEETWFVIKRTGQVFGGLIAGRESADQLSGPIRLAKMAGDVAQEGGFGGLITLTAFLSISIGLINLLPIPVLDGGHLMFYAIEAIIGRPLSENAKEYAFRAGFLVILLLIGAVFAIDIMALRGS